MTATRTAEPIFRHEEREDGVYHAAIPKLDIKERKRRLQIIPNILKSRRHLTEPELKAAAYVQMGTKPHYMETVVGGMKMKIPFARYFNPVEMQEMDLFGTLTEIQRIACHKDFQPKLRKIAIAHNSDHERKKGTTYDLGSTIQPGRATNGIQLGGIAKSQDPEVMRMINLVSKVGSTMIRRAFPDTDREALERRWVTDASLTIGDEDNHEVSSIQINFSKPSDKLETAIKDVGKIHKDGNDDRCRFTALLFLPYFPKDHFPGRFLITTARLTCTACPFSGLVFTGTHAHFATGIGKYGPAIGPESPLRYRRPHQIVYPKLPEGTPYARIAIVSYPKKHLMRPGTKNLRADMHTPAIIAHCVTQQNMWEFRMRTYVKDNFGILRASSTPVDQICEGFSWIGKDGQKCYPRRRLAVLGLHYADKPDPEWDTLNKAVAQFSCGSKFPNEKGKPRKKSTKCGEEEWIDVELPAQTIKDKIPAKDEWTPSLERASAFLDAKLKRSAHGEFTAVDHMRLLGLEIRRGVNALEFDGSLSSAGFKRRETATKK